MRFEGSSLLNVVAEERKVENKGNPVPVDQEQKGQEAMDGSFGNDVGVQTVAKIDGVDVVAVDKQVSLVRGCGAEDALARLLSCAHVPAVQGYWRRASYHSRSLYMIVKKT